MLILNEFMRFFCSNSLCSEIFLSTIPSASWLKGRVSLLYVCSNVIGNILIVQLITWKLTSAMEVVNLLTRKWLERLLYNALIEKVCNIDDSGFQLRLMRKISESSKSFTLILGLVKSTIFNDLCCFEREFTSSHNEGKSLKIHGSLFHRPVVFLFLIAAILHRINRFQAAFSRTWTHVKNDSMQKTAFKWQRRQIREQLWEQDYAILFMQDAEQATDSVNS